MGYLLRFLSLSVASSIYQTVILFPIISVKRTQAIILSGTN